MPPTPSGYVPGAPIISTADLHEGLTRLQAGQTEFDVGGATVRLPGIPVGLHNVLRDLQESPLGHSANQLESMTIEMVAMLFDFIFETKDLPDGIKALLARLQIPVLKAAMLDGAFFAKKTHPARLLVNELAQAGLGWSPVMGSDDPLYREIERIVHAVLERLQRGPHALRGPARGPRGLPRRGGEGGRGERSRSPPRRSTPATGTTSRSRSHARRSRSASRATRCRRSSPPSCASTGWARWRRSTSAAARTAKRGPPG